MSASNVPDGVFIHPNAIVETRQIGPKTRIWAFAHVLEGAIIGSDCNVCDHSFIEGDVVIGDRVTVKSGVYLWDGLRVEDDVFIAPNATFTNVRRPRSKAYPDKYPITVLGQGCAVGANATVLCGITIGKWAMIGAGSVVTKSVPDYALAYGNPAKIQGYICQCTEHLNFIEEKAGCSCGKNYVIRKGEVSLIR